MLKFIRRNASGMWVKGIFGLIAAIFIFWGIGARNRGGTHFEPIAVVNGHPIEEIEFQRSYNNLLRLYQDVYKDNFRPEMVQGMDLKGKAIDQLVRVTLMRQESERLGLRASETEVRDSIAAMKTFQQGDRFDKEMYIRALHYNKLTPGEFEDAQRDELLVNKLQDLIAAGVHVSEAEARERFDFDNEKVNLNFVSFQRINYQSEVTLTNDEVQQYFDAHKDAFRVPDKVRVEYVLFNASKLVDKISVGDADVQAYYDAHTAEYSKPERVHARHILLKVDEGATPEIKADARKRAEEILAKAKAGEDFEKLAKENSQDAGSAENGGDLGFFPRGQMVPDFEAVAFSLPQGGMSELVETPFGFHIIKVEAKEAAHTQPLAEVREEIVSKLTHDKSYELAHNMANSGHDKVAQGGTLESVAQELGLSVGKPSPFAEGESVDDLGRTLLSGASFTVQPGALGSVLEVPEGYFIFRVIEKIAAHQAELAEVLRDVEAAARDERTKAIAKSKAEAFLAEVQKSDFDGAAKAAGLEVQESGPFLKVGTFMPKIGNSADLKKDAFQLTAEKPVAPAVYNVNNDSVVVALKEHIKSDDAQFEQQKKTLVQQAEQRRKSQVMSDFVNYLKARADVKLNSGYLDKVAETGRPLDRPLGRP